MPRLFLPALLTSLALFFPPTLPAQDLAGIEQRLKADFENKWIDVQPVEADEAIAIDIPKDEREAAGWDETILRLIENLTLKASQLEISARQYSVYRTREGVTRELKGDLVRYKLKWRGAAPDEAHIREVLGRVFRVLPPELDSWENYWPPPLPFEAYLGHGPDLRERPSQELAPGVFTVGKGITPPRCSSCPLPVFPAAGMGGTYRVWVWVLVTKSGRVAGIQIAQSGGEVYDVATVVNVSQWRFHLGLRDGHPVRIAMALIHAYFRS